MLAYRTDEDAARLVAEQLERETAEVFRENVALATRLARVEAARDAALERLAEAGPNAGRPSARRDRVGLGAGLLAAAAVALLPLQALLVTSTPATRSSWGAVVPLLLLLGAPGALAASIARRYRRISWTSRLAFAIGAFVAGLTLVEIVIGVSP